MWDVKINFSDSLPMCPFFVMFLLQFKPHLNLPKSSGGARGDYDGGKYTTPPLSKLRLKL